MGLSEENISCILTTNFKERYKQGWYILEKSPVADVKIELRYMMSKGAKVDLGDKMQQIIVK